MNKRSKENSVAGSSNCEVCKKNKKILRSSEQNKKEQEKTKQQECKHTGVEENEEMEVLREMIKEILYEVKTSIPDLKNEIKELKNELRQREEKWEKEKKTLEKRIENLETNAERDRKYKRKNNIIIKGLQLGTGEVAEQVKVFLMKVLKVRTHIKKAYKIGNDSEKCFIVAEIQSWNKNERS